MAKGGDIGSYIKSNNTKLTPGNYSELDSLVFSELSYTKLESIEGGKSYTVKEAADLLLKAENSTGNPNADTTAFLKAVRDSDRYSECVIRNIQTENKDAQWAAMTIDLDKSGSASTIAFRGTNGTTLGWREDFELYYDVNGTKAQQLSTEYLKNTDANNIILTGHSKGGNDAISAYVSNSSEIRDKVVRIDNFDGPGLNPEYVAVNGSGYVELGDKLYNYYPEDSVVGQLMIDNPGNNTWIKTDTKGHTTGKGIFDNHDLFSWKIDDGNFVEGKQSAASIIIDDIVDTLSAFLPNWARTDIVRLLCLLGIPTLIAGDKGDFIGQEWDYILKHLKNFDIEALQMLIGIYKFPELIGAFTTALAAVLLRVKIEQAFKIAMEGVKKSLEYLTKLSTDIANAISNVLKKVSESMAGAWDYIKKKVDDFFNRKGSSSAGIANANFHIDLSALTSCSNDFITISQTLSRLSSSVNSVQHNLLLTTSLGNLFKMEKIEYELVSLSDKAKKFDKTLDEVVKRYQKADKGVKSLVT